MDVLVTIFHTLISFLLIIAVLLQSGKGGGLASSIGGGTGDGQEAEDEVEHRVGHPLSVDGAERASDCEQRQQGECELFEQGAGAQTVLVGAGDRWSINFCDFR
mgnify:CR=1 FL=1